ncbi:MAG: nicotinate-nucleotide--dimethylbenzimidazole phosphoribosyltransferase [Candidatus Aureabacteria bacterium]|nr:nicotinate-nucleotide--dimethylbenzimidazole phosphoribosyltransferase [Candidatus Auribacterota bacterium]
MRKMDHIINNIQGLDQVSIKMAQTQLDSLTKPRGSLGRLEELAKQLAGITRQKRFSLKNKVIFTLAADHGIAEEGISAYPQEVTIQMVYNFLNDGAGINVLARMAGARVVIVDMGVAHHVDHPKTEMGSFKNKKIRSGTMNFIKEPAMTRDEAVRSLEAGMDVLEEELEKGVDIIGTGEMGIGNTTSASAITACITGHNVKDVTGLGTGIDEKRLEYKKQLIEKALTKHKPDPLDAIDVLSKVGGFEIGGMAGIMLAAAHHKIPVIIDGFISGTAALIASQLQPKVKEYMIAAHCSVEKGHTIILRHMGLKPLLDLDLRLGEGTGAALAMNIVEAGAKIFHEMATFENAGVSQKETL